MNQEEKVTLYSYYRSSCSWRVRIALNMKKIPHDIKPINLLKGEQLTPEYLLINPSGSLPCLQVEQSGKTVFISQSLAIIYFLDAHFGGASLIPKDPFIAAKAIELAMLIIADTQPLQNLKVLKKVGEDKKEEWARLWIESGLQTFEKKLVEFCGKFCVGDSITIADICLIPQIYNARRFGCDLTLCPKIMSIEQTLNSIPEFIAASPENQLDFPK